MPFKLVFLTRLFPVAIKQLLSLSGWPQRIIRVCSVENLQKPDHFPLLPSKNVISSRVTAIFARSFPTRGRHGGLRRFAAGSTRWFFSQSLNGWLTRD